MATQLRLMAQPTISTIRPSHSGRGGRLGGPPTASLPNDGDAGLDLECEDEQREADNTLPPQCVGMCAGMLRAKGGSGVL